MVSLGEIDLMPPFCSCIVSLQSFLASLSWCMNGPTTATELLASSPSRTTPDAPRVCLPIGSAWWVHQDYTYRLTIPPILHLRNRRAALRHVGQLDTNNSRCFLEAEHCPLLMGHRSCSEPGSLLPQSSFPSSLCARFIGY